MRPSAHATAIETERLLLTPLRVYDAADMAVVLSDQGLHEFIGGSPSDAAELRARYGRMVAGSSNPDEVWLNWIVRRRAEPRPIGTMQATLLGRDDRWDAHLAWVIGLEYQGDGFASEAAKALVSWLQLRGADRVDAHIHPKHRASEVVAIRAGLHLTDDVVDGERVWRTRPEA
jgi:RimJ/RimL family protein N-acetyltransferase